MKTYIGLDIGFSRIGIAIGNDSISIAFPNCIAPFEDYFRKISEIMKEKTIDAFVVGIPKPLAQETSKHCEAIEDEIKKIEKYFSLPVYRHNEQFTSKIAEQSLSLQGFSQKKQKGKKDAIAATIILQEFLDRK